MPTPPAENITVAVPQDLPTPYGVRLPESFDVPGHMIDRVPQALP